MSKRENEADGGQLDPQGNHLSPETQIVQRLICVKHKYYNTIFCSFLSMEYRLFQEGIHRLFSQGKVRYKFYIFI